MTTETAEKVETTEQVAPTVSEVARLFAEEGRWSERRRAAVAAVAAAKGTTGAALLDGGEGALPKQARTLATLRAEIDACDEAIAEARRRRVQAILTVWRGEAEAVRREAAELVAEADGRQPKTAKLLAALEEWENVEYVPKPSTPANSILSGGVSGGAPQVVIVPTPKTALLRHRAAGLEEQATRLEARVVTKQGTITGMDRDELLRQVAAGDSMQIAPTAAAVETWLEEAEPPVLERRLRLNTSNVGYGAPLAYTLTWVDGEVDTRRSKVRLPALDD